MVKYVETCFWKHVHGVVDRCLSLFFSTCVPSQRVSLFVTRPLTTNAAQMVRVVSHANVDEEEEVGG